MPFAAPEGEEPLATTLEQAASVHTWKLIAPVSPASGSLSRAARAGRALSRTPFAGDWSVGTLGAVRSSVKLLVAVQLDSPPAASVACARQ